MLFSGVVKESSHAVTLNYAFILLTSCLFSNASNLQRGTLASTQYRLLFRHLCSDTLTLPPRTCRPLITSVSFVARRWSPEQRNCRVTTFSTPGELPPTGRSFTLPAPRCLPPGWFVSWENESAKTAHLRWRNQIWNKIWCNQGVFGNSAASPVLSGY